MPAVLFSGCSRHETVATLVVGALLRFFFFLKKTKKATMSCAKSTNALKDRPV